MTLSIMLLILLTVAAAYTDFRYRRIPNGLTLGGLALGLAVQTASEGLHGLAVAFTGAATGFGIMLLLHMFGALGAGDVKLFGAIGALAGPWLTLSAVTYSIVFAGAIGVCILAAKRQLITRGTAVFNAVFGIICLSRLDAVQSVGHKRDMIRFPFLLAVVPGLAAAFWENWW